MDTLHVTRAAEGEHWLASTDVTTIRALGFEAPVPELVARRREDRIRERPGGTPEHLRDERRR